MGIRQLAKELGLSIGTVSRALNDRPDVNEDTRARVKLAARRLGYVPNQAGRSLRRGSTGMIAAIVPADGPIPGAESFFLSVFAGVRRVLREADLDLIVLFAAPDDDPLAELARVAARRIADGFIVTRTVPQDARFAFLADAGIPYAAFGRSADVGSTSWVDLDLEASVVRSVELFAAAGHTSIALALNGLDTNINSLMRHAFLARTARHGFAAKATPVLALPGHGLSGEARAALESACPTAILAGGELVAARLYASLPGLGRAVGQDVAVISLYPVLGPEALRPRLSHFEADLDALGGELGVRMLASLPGTGVSPAGPSRPFPMVFAPRESHRLAAA